MQSWEGTPFVNGANCRSHASFFPAEFLDCLPPVGPADHRTGRQKKDDMFRVRVAGYYA